MVIVVVVVVGTVVVVVVSVVVVVTVVVVVYSPTLPRRPCVDPVLLLVGVYARVEVELGQVTEPKTLHQPPGFWEPPRDGCSHPPSPWVCCGPDKGTL